MILGETAIGRIESKAMVCPTWEELDDLVSGELPESRRAEMVDHAKTCAKCQEELRALLGVYSALHAEVLDEPCPSLEVLAPFAKQELAISEKTSVERHVARCPHCKLWIEVLLQSPLALMDDIAPNEVSSVDTKRALVYEMLDRLMPGRENLIATLWDRVQGMVNKLQELPMEQWPSFRGPATLSGALGFIGAPDHEMVSAAIILATGMATFDRAARGEVVLEQAGIKTAAQDIAQRFGAGRELTARLGEAASTVLLS
jgi:hypothetical protein